MIYIVELRYFSGDLADAMIAMRTWLDRKGIQTERFDCCSGCPGLAFRVGFRNRDHAASFAAAFGGWVQDSDPRQIGLRWTCPPTKGETGEAAAREAPGQSQRAAARSSDTRGGPDMRITPAMSLAA